MDRRKNLRTISIWVFEAMKLDIAGSFPYKYKKKKAERGKVGRGGKEKPSERRDQQPLGLLPHFLPFHYLISFNYHARAHDD